MIAKALIAVALIGVAAANYCSVCKDHTMCKFKTTDIGSACVSYQFKALTRKDINDVVHAHNKLRNRVALGQESLGGGQPAASNMRKMVWSSELAKIAQTWANQCNFSHDTCRNSADKTLVGQNVYWEASSVALKAVNWYKPVQDWYDEVKDRKPGSLNVQPFRSTSGPVVGHYTQVAWANSWKVGCGYADYKQGTWFARIVVCNYGPTGNMIGDKMYEAGAAASKCPAGTTKDSFYAGLCART